MNRFDVFADAVETNGVGVLPWRHELISPTGKILATTSEDLAAGGSVIKWGCTLRPLEVDARSISQRSARATVVADELALVPAVPGDLLHPETNNRVRSWSGLQTSTGDQYWVQSTLRIEEADVSGQSGSVVVELFLVDAIAPLRSDFTDSFTFNAGEQVEDVVAKIIAQVLPDDQVSLTATGYETPSGSASHGDSRFQLVDELLAGCGHELAVDASGIVYNRPVPATTRPSGRAWRFGDGGIPMGSPSKLIQAREPRGWVVEVGGLQSSDPEITVTVFDQDPASNGYFTGSGSVRLEKIELPWILKEDQGRAAGYALMRRDGAGPGSIRFTSIPNPALNEGDLIVVKADHIKASGDYLVRSIKMPIQVDGLMTVEARRVWDPELGLEPPAINPPASRHWLDFPWADKFERENQKLEVLPSLNPARVQWTEVGTSFEIIDNQAVQTQPGRWCFAFLNVPFIALDGHCEVTPSKIPDGMFIGPMMRGGTDGSGYAALADSNGRISLEVWQNLKMQDVIGSFDSGASVVGRKIRMEATGSNIVVKLDGSTVISVADDRRTDRRSGFLALGGTYPNAPAVTWFHTSPVIDWF